MLSNTWSAVLADVVRPMERTMPCPNATDVAVAAPNVGVTNVGLLANTKAPVPVSSVMAARRLDDEGVAKKVATSVPKPLIPVETGKPVQLVNVPDEGVPNTGAVKVGDVSVLLVSVSVPANVAKSASLNAVLN